MSSAISVASSISDEDEIRPQDDLEDEEAAGHRRDHRDEKHKYRLKVLNFNLFAGSPVPVLFRSLLPKTESLEGSERLKLQVERIKAMGPDIICLQEACSDGVERYEPLSDQTFIERIWILLGCNTYVPFFTTARITFIHPFSHLPFPAPCFRSQVLS